MKKILGMAGLLIAAVIFAYTFRLKTVGYLDTSVMAVTDRQMTGTLKAGISDHEDRRIVTLQKYQAAEPLYSRGNRYYLGQEKTQLDISYPFYVNSGTSLYFMTDQTKLITSDFAAFDSYHGLFLSDGRAYTSLDGSSDMMELADEEEYIMTSIGGGIYQNLQPMKVTSDSKENDYRLNSFLYLDDNVIRAYSYEDDALVYMENPVSVSSRVSIGSLNMSYSEFLGYLKTAAGNSDFSTGIDMERQDQPNTDLNEERSHEEGERQTADPKVQEALPADVAEAANGTSGAAGGEVAAAANGEEGLSPENNGKGDGILDSGDSDQKGSTNGEGDEGSGGSRGDIGGSGDSGGSGGGSNGGGSDRNDGSSSGNSGSGSGAANGSDDGNGSGDGNQDGGNHDGNTSGGNGSNGSQNSGNGSGQGQGNGGEKPNPDDKTFHEPKVTMTAPEMGVYYLKSSLHIDDPDGRLVRVIIRAYLNGKQGGRKNLKSDTDFKIQNLRPGKTYEIKGEMVYRNELGVKVTKPFMENIEVKTKDLDTLAPLTLNFEDADTYATQSISVKNMTLTGPKAQTEAEEVLLTYANRVKIIVKGYEDQDENLGSTLVRKMRQGEKVDWTSGEDFKSNSSYDYRIDVQDRFGNSLQLTADSRTEGHTRTCKVMPKAAMVELVNQVGKQTVGVQLTNTDKVTMSNLRLKVTDLDGKVLPAFAGNDSYYRSLDANEAGRQNIDITMLPTGINIIAVVEADFDLGDKPQANNKTEREIGRINLYTAPISRLGSVYADITTANVTASSVDITFAIDQEKTLEGLLALMSQARVLISDPNGTIVYNSMVDDGTHLNGVSQSSELVSGKINVGLESNYLFDRERLSGNGWTKAGDGSFVIQNSNSVNSIPQVKVAQPSGAACENPWEALKKGGVVTLSFPRATEQFSGSFKSMTKYQVTVQAVATQAGINHSVGYGANVSSFRTIRRAPAFEYDGAFTIADRYSIYGFRIDDPDGTIPGGEVQMRVSTNGSVVMARSLATNEDPEDVIITDLRQGSTYLITFMTTLYNEGYDSTTQEERTFSQQFKFTVGEEVSGTIQLNGLSDKDQKMNAKIQVAMSGRNSNLIDNQYHVEIYGAAGIDTSNEKVLQNRLNTWESTGLPQDMTGITHDYEYICDRNWKYIMRLVVNVRGYQVILDDVKFTTEESIVAYTSWEDVKDSSGTVIEHGLRPAMEADKTGKFVITKDMVKTSDNRVGSAAVPFNGTLDFQGHTLTTVNTNADGSKTYYPAPLFYYTGSEAVVENLVYDWTWDNSVYSSYHTFYRWGAITGWNWGTIRNVKLNIDMSGRQYVNGLGGIVYQNYASGLIEDFVVSLNHEFYVTSSSGVVCSENNGQIRNGYVYSGGTGGTNGINSGSGIYGGNEKQSHSSVGVVAANRTGALVENVFSLINVSIEDGTNMIYTGGLVGYNVGIVRNSFWVGDIYHYGYDADKVQTASSLYRLSGGIVGNNANGAKVEGLYNISLQPEPVDYGMDTGLTKRIANYASTETIQRLWDFVWYNSVFNASANFDVRNQLDAGYYPKLQLSEVMSGVQDDVKLPPSSGVNIPTYISNTVKEQGSDWAIVDLYFNNPHLQEICAMNIENLTTEILEQHSESSFYVVRVKLLNPKTFKSSYRLLNFDYRITATSDNTAKGNPSESALIKVKMYKQILDATDWVQIVRDPSSNYQLEADLDFSKIATDQMVVRGSFTGELDGNGYTISNLSPSGNAAYIFEKVSGGTIQNLNVENLNLIVNDSQQAKAGAVYAGFIGRTEETSTLNNIRLSDVTLDGMPGAAGALAGQTSNTTVTNCRAEQVRLITSSYTGTALRTGGLIGETLDSAVKSCYVSSLDLTAIKGFASTGIGGLIGNSSGSGSVTNVYAHGSMKVSFTSVGGAIGRSTTDVTNVWTMVDVNSNMGQLGGVVGVMGSGMIQNTLVIGDLATTSSNELGRIYGGMTSGSALITMTNGIASSNQIFGNNASDVLQGTHATALVPKEALENVEPYRDQARLGTGFDLMGEASGYQITSGYMPMLLNTGGEVLENQSPVLRKDGRLKIINGDLKANQDGSYTLTIEAATGKNNSFELKSVECDAFNLGETSGAQRTTESSTFGQMWRITYPKVTLQQYLSTYTLSVVFEKTENGKLIQQKLSYQLNGNYYRRISSANEWVTVMSEYGQNFENFEITKDIDLSSVAQNVIVDRNLVNLKINSLRSANGGSYTIRGLKYIAQEESESIIASLAGTVENVTFENMSISNYERGLGGTNVGLIGQNNGTIQNVTFKGIEVKGNSANHVGCIGQNNGVVQDVTVQDVKITSNKGSAAYVGGLIGYNTGTVSGIVAEGTSSGDNYRTHYTKKGQPQEAEYSYVVNGGNYVGGVVGYSTSAYSDISLKAAYVGGWAYVGGICSWADVVTVENLSVGDPDDKRLPVMVTGSSQKVGGVIGSGPSGAGQGVYTYIKDIKLYNSYVIGQDYTGGLLGVSGNWFVQMYDSFVEHATISGNNSVAGICGSSVTSIRIYIEDSKISGVNTVGGIAGSTGPLSSDYGYTVKGCIIEGSGNRIGGIVGNHNDSAIQNAAIINSIVRGTSSNSQYVGGLAGTATASIYYNDVINTKVSGGTAVGGLAGRAQGNSFYWCSIEADVSASRSKAGGAFGELIGFDSTATIGSRQTTSAYGLIIGGKVSALTMAGGFAGSYSITPALYDTSGNLKASGSSKLQSSQYHNITLMDQVICESDDSDDQNTCSVWAYFTPNNSVSSLVGGSPDYVPEGRLTGIVKSDGSNNECGAVWSGVKVVQGSTGDEIYPLSTYLGNDFTDWSSVTDDKTANKKNVVISIADMKTPYFWRQQLINDSSVLLVDKESGKYDSSVVADGKAPMAHCRWRVVLADRDADGKPILNADGVPTGNTVSLVSFLDGTRTYKVLENGQYVDKPLSVFMLPNSGDNPNWKGTGTTTLTAGENLMVYASDVASLNLEVADEVVEASAGAVAQSGTDELMQAAADPILLTVSDSQGVIFAAPVTQKVYTIPYDFSTTLTAELTQGDVVQEYEISARNLVHTVMNYDGDYYYMTGSGIRSSAWADDTTASKAKTTASGAADNSASADQEEAVVQGLCEGKFLNMWAGKALDVNGDVWDLASRTVEARSVVDRDAMAETAEAVLNVAGGQAVAACSMDDAAGLDGTDHANGTQNMVDAMKQLADIESQPLYQFQYGDTTLEVYGKDTISVKDGEENTLDSLIYVKNGYLYPVDNELDAVTGAILADAYSDNRYLSVLTGEGVIQDLGNDLTLPDGFKNCSIAELADNLASDSRVAIGRYKNGTAFAFDYITGKTIDLYEDEYDTGNDVGIFDYAKDWIVSKAGSWFGLNNSGYKGAQNMIAQYQQGGSNGILGQLRQIERTITTWKDGADTKGNADSKDGTASGVDNAEGTDGAGLTGDADQNSDAAQTGGSEQNRGSDQNGALDQNSGSDQSKTADQASDQKDNTDLADDSDTTTVDGSQNSLGAASEKKASEKKASEKADADAEKADAQEKDSKNAGNQEQSGDKAQTGVQPDAEKSDAGQTSGDSQSNQASGADQTAKDGQQAQEISQSEKDQKTGAGDKTASDEKSETGDPTAAGKKSETSDPAVTGEKSEAGDPAAAGQRAEAGDQAVSGQTDADKTTSAGETTETAADGTKVQQSQAKAKDQLVTIYNADTKSYEVYDVEDFLSGPKSEIATISEKVKELTKQGLINNATDLKAEDTITDTNRYGIWIYCGIAAAILLLLGYLADRKRRQWK